MQLAAHKGQSYLDANAERQLAFYKRPWGADMCVRLWVAGVCFAGLLSACAAVDPVDSRYDTINRSLAKARNESILVNLMRASQDYPLNFVTISNVTPTLTNTSILGLPTFLFGPGFVSGSTNSLFTPGRDVIFSNSVASNSTAISTNFSVSTQETTSFYEGFLKPIDLQVLDYFIRQGYSRELLFWLFADAVEVSVPGKRPIGTRYDPPSDYGCRKQDPRRRCFSEFVLVAIAAGLTVEEKTIQQPSRGGGNAEKSTASGSSGKPQTIVVPRFCFSDVLQQEAERKLGSSYYHMIATRYFDGKIEYFSPKCGAPWDPEKQTHEWQSDTFPFQVGQLKYTIVPRSAYGVFQFLGTLIKLQRDHPMPEGWIPEELLAQGEADLPTLKTAPRNDDPYIITVVPNVGGLCFVHTWFLSGDYCVPENAANTKRIFSLLAQLIAITTNATDLSITPSVRVIQ